MASVCASSSAVAAVASSQKGKNGMAATRAAFLGGRKLRQEKLSVPAVTPRGLSVLAAAADPERPLWFPGSTPPAWLDGSLPGDFGFDPLGLSSDPAHSYTAAIGQMASRADPLSTHLVSQNHPRFLDLSQLRELPDSHTWPDCTENPFSDRDQTQLSHVPVVDLQNPNVLRLLANACETWGVFQITGHGVPAALLDRLELQCQRLFYLPPEQKLKALRAPDGISGYGQVRISSLFSKLMWSEGFTIIGSPEEHARKLWPQDHHQFCEVIEEYNQELKQLAGRLMALMLEALSLRVEEVSWYRDGFSEATSVLQLNSYPACPEPEKAMGLAAHTDSSLFTILHQNRTSGLQVMPPKGRRWITVPPSPTALVVNIGDLFHIISNGRCPSVVHRAVVNRSQHRFSVAYLYGPPADAEIAPVGPRTVHSRLEPLYRAVTWPEYLGIKSKKRFDQALESIRVAPSRDEVCLRG